MGTRALSRMLSGSVASSASASRSTEYGALEGIPLSAIKRKIDDLVENGLVACYEEDGFRLLRLTSDGRAVLEGKRTRQQAPARSLPEDAASRDVASDTVPSSSQPSAPEETGSEVDEDLYERLCDWRLEVARENKLPPYVVFHNTVLRRIAAHRPATLDDLEAIKGIGPKKRQTYGVAVLAVVTGGAAVAADDSE
jgi:superfamily II DNA helicase RecQ